MAKGAITVKIDGQYDNKDINRAIRDLKALQTETKNAKKPFIEFNSGIDDLGKKIAGAFAVGAVGGAMLDFFKDSAAAAMEDQASLVKLATAMDNLGLSSQNAIAEDFISKLSMAVGVADDNLRPALQRLLTVTGDLTTSQDALSLALDISAGTGKDLDSVSTALAKAYGGQTTALGRLGVGLDSALLKSKDMGAITDALSAKFGGQAGAAAETYAGQMNRVNVAMGEAKEKVGYALLDALDKAATAFGGTDGLVGAIDAAGQSLGNFVAGLGVGTTAIADFLAGANNLVEANTSGSMSFGDLAVSVYELLPGTKLVDDAYRAIISSGADANAQQAVLAEAMKRSAAQALLEGRAVADTDRATAGLATSAEVAAQATSDLKDKFKDLSGTLSNQSALDSYATALRTIKDELDKHSRSLDINTDAGAKNRQAIINLFGDAVSAVQAWADKTGANTTEIDRKFATMTGNIRQKLIDQGFKAKDVDKFLGGMDLWDESTRDAIKAATAAAKAEAKLTAYAAFLGIGKDMAAGLAQGVQSGQVYADLAVREMMHKAEEAARAEIESNSPSKKFAKIGNDVVDGLVVGIDSKQSAVKDKSRQMAQAIIDGAKSMIDGWDTELDRLKGIYDGALADFNSFKEGITSSIFGQLDLSGAVDAAKETGGSIVDALAGQAAGIGKFTQNLIELTKTNLSQAAWQAVSQLSADRGAGLTNAMLGAQGQAIIDGVNKIYGDVDTMANAVGILAAQKWYGKGVEQAQKTYEGFRDNFGEGGPARKALMGLMDNLAHAMDRTATITVTTVNKVINETIGTFGGARAAGGPVANNTAYLVGERGPEIFVPSTDGTIIPNHIATGASGAGGGNSYTVNVSAGVGDPRAIGQTVIEYIKKFESSNGKVFAAA